MVSEVVRDSRVGVFEGGGRFFLFTADVSNVKAAFFDGLFSFKDTGFKVA